MRKIIFLSIKLSVIVAFILLYIGFQHNPQNEFYNFETGVMDITYIVQFIFWNIVLIFVIFFIIFSIVRYIYIKFRNM